MGNQLRESHSEEFDALGFEEMSENEILQLMMEAYQQTGNQKYIDPNLYLKDKYEFYPTDPVDVEKWLFDKDYFGHMGEFTWNVVKQEFLDVMSRNPRPGRLVLKGSIGWGKTFFSCLAMARILYELGCLRNPQEYFGLAPGSNISFMNMSVSGGHARRILFTQLKQMLDTSPWFTTNMPRKKPSESVIYYPRKMISLFPGTSSELAPLGEHLFGGVIEEANFFPVIVGSRRIKNPSEREWDQAKKIHDAMWRRIKSRFQIKGKIPGMLILNSSANYPEDFLEKMTGSIDSDTLVITHNQFETKDKTRFSDKKFFVFIGDRYTAPRIMKSVEEREKYKKKGEVLGVPEDYIRDFHLDLDGSIRDILGKNVRATNKFFVDVTKVKAIAEPVVPPIPIPFGDKWMDGMDADVLFQALKYSKFFNPIQNMKKKKPRLIHHPQALRFAHIDLSTTGDATGFCVGHIAQMKEVKRRVSGGEEVVKEVLPIIYVDLILRIMPPLGGEILFEDIRTLLFDLHQKVGFRFAKITYDSWQSIGSIQVLRKRFGDDVVGILHSGMRKGGSNHWWVLREAIYERRVHCYDYPPLLRELSAMEREPVHGIIDHPVGGWDDTAVALAGMVFNVMENFEVGMVDQIQTATPEFATSAEEELEASVGDWLMDDDKRKARKEKQIKADGFDKDEWDLDKMSPEEIEAELAEDEEEEDVDDL